MKKKVVSALLCISMVATMLVGCGSNNSSNNKETNNTKKEESTGGETSSTDEGEVLNIYCWNEEFKSRITDHYPSYEEVDATTGKIGDVTVK